MMHDSMEFYEVYRSRLADAGAAAKRRSRPLPGPLGRGRRLPLLCGRVLLVSGQVLVTAGKRLSAVAAGEGAPSHG